LAGRLMRADKLDGTKGKYKFKVLEFPAIDMSQAKDKKDLSKGRALWPEKFSLEYLLHLRNSKAGMGPTNFGSLYQQKPREESDYTIKKDWAQIIPGMPGPEAVLVRCYDLAFKTKEKNDFTATVKISWSDKEGEVIEDFEQWKEPIPQTMERVETKAVEEGQNVRVGILAGGTQIGYVQMLQNKPRLLGHIIEGLPEIHDKIVNAVPWITRMKDGLVRLRAGKWNTELLDLLEAFGPNCDHDDAPDAISGGNSMLSQYIDYSVTPNVKHG
jgi:predicted phage terminase large subunit-like protein